MIAFEITGSYELMIHDNADDYDLQDDLEWYFEDPEVEEVVEDIIAWASDSGCKVIFDAEHKCFEPAQERFVRLLARLQTPDAAFHFRMRFGYGVARPISDVQEMGRD